jgi:hydroxyacylglutathione hydrolase
VDFAVEAPEIGDLDVRWIHGSPRGKRNNDPLFQVHRYDRHTYVLRQSKALSAEAPFLYLLFGNDRAVLFDTGAVKKAEGNPLRETVDGIIDSWLADHPREDYHLVVAHTHGHLDHVAGDGQFGDRPEPPSSTGSWMQIRRSSASRLGPTRPSSSTSAAASSS